MGNISGGENFIFYLIIISNEIITAMHAYHLSVITAIKYISVIWTLKYLTVQVDSFYNYLTKFIQIHWHLYIP